MTTATRIALVTGAGRGLAGRARRGAAHQRLLRVRALDKYLAHLAFLLLAATAAPAGAEHEIYYRYTVLGYLRDAAGRPRQGAQVELVREKTGFSYLARTDARGFYVVVVRLADDGLGEKLRIRAGGLVTVVTARFDPADHRRERGTRVDFAGQSAREAPAAFAPTLERFLSE
jgi:hypothetical protein